MGVGWPSFHLCIFGACRCITTALFSVAVFSARVMERSDSITSSHPMIPVLCLLLRIIHARLPTQMHMLSIPSSVSFSHCNLRCCQLAQSCLQFNNPPFLNCALCRPHVSQTLSSSSSAILLLGTTSGSFLSLASADAFFKKLNPTAHAYCHVRPGPLGSLPFCGFIFASPGTSAFAPRCSAILGCSIR